MPVARLVTLAALATLTVCLALALLPRPSQAGGLVTDCTTHADLQAKLAGGGTVTFRCGTATIPIGATLDVTSNTTIDGGGRITLDGLEARRIISTAAGTTLTLTNLTLTRGKAVSGNGGAVVAQGDLVAHGVTFTRNTAFDGGAVYASGVATVTASVFLSNTATLDGGGLWANAGATVSASTFTSNTAGSDGGGLFTLDEATVSGTSFTRNSAGDQGGGLWAIDDVTVSASSFTSNTAGSDGGGLYEQLVTSAVTVNASTFHNNTAGALGGGLRAWGAISVENSTLAANQAPTGAAIAGFSGVQPSLIAFSTLANNVAATSIITTNAPTTLRNIILTGGSGTACDNAVGKTLSGQNFLVDNTCGLPYKSVLPQLGPLADHGGSTLTHALLTGSPAIGVTTSCPAADQRGLPRGDPCDAGAYEYGIAPTLMSLLPPAVNQGGPGVTLTVTGTGFIVGTTALWNGGIRPTTVVSSTTLRVVISAGDVAAAGTTEVQARYGVAADSVSNALAFTILAPTPTSTSTAIPTATATPTLAPGEPTLTPTPTATLLPGGQPVARLPLAWLNQSPDSAALGTAGGW